MIIFISIYWCSAIIFMGGSRTQFSSRSNRVKRPNVWSLVIRVVGLITSGCAKIQYGYSRTCYEISHTCQNRWDSRLLNIGNSTKSLKYWKDNAQTSIINMLVYILYTFVLVLGFASRTSCRQAGNTLMQGNALTH